jgi:hypothetical protein
VNAAEGKLQEPANSDSFYYLDRGTGTLSPLEQQVSKRYFKNKFFTIRGGYEIAGVRSSFRIRSGQPQEFLIRFSPSLGLDRKSEWMMQTYVYLIRASDNRDRREITTAEWTMLSGEKINEDRIPCDVKPYGNDSALITPHEVLPAGEYAFFGYAPDCKTKYETVFYAFGIDPPGAD